MNRFVEYGYIAAFLVLAGISCWATEHSFHLLIKWMPEAFVWGLTIAFFVLASYGTKLIVDACNHDIYIEHRRRDFWIGTILVVIFWLLMSMPTNTHTFFYNHAIGNTVMADISDTNSYLSQVRSREVVDPEYGKLHNKVHGIFKKLGDEFNGIGVSGRHGGGEYVRGYVLDINNLLEQELPGTSITFNDAMWNRFEPAVLTSYENQMNAALAKVRDEKYRVPAQAAAQADSTINRLEALNSKIQKMVAQGDVDEADITEAESELHTGYSIVKNNSHFVNFGKNEADKETYTRENIETRTKRMLSVIDVWADFMQGKYPVSFLFYVLLSVLVDVGAFIFFDLAFHKQD